jgi:hypothetical protein
MHNSHYREAFPRFIYLSKKNINWQTSQSPCLYVFLPVPHDKHISKKYFANNVQLARNMEKT